MSVSVEGGKGRGKGMMVDLNLVPFIDFLSCLIAFLMIAAVWTQIASIDVEQAVSPPNPDVLIPEPPPPPPLTIAIHSDGMFICRKLEDGTRIPKIGEDQDWKKLKEMIKADHDAFATEQMVVINTDDGVSYEEMIKALDLTREFGYPQTALAGGAPGALPGAAPTAPAGG
jgi:biopolymer transport protein ExbD